MADAAQIRKPITRAQLCEALDVTPEWLDRHIARMRRDQGFPKPLLNGKYDPAAVADWQERQRAGRRPLTEPAAANDDEDEIVAAQRAMDARAAARRSR